MLKYHRLYMRLMLGLIKTTLKNIWGFRVVVSGPDVPQMHRVMAKTINLGDTWPLTTTLKPQIFLV